MNLEELYLELLRDGDIPSTPSTPTQENCAWCLKEQGITSLEESHGICTPHADQVYSSYRATRAQRRGRAAA